MSDKENELVGKVETEETFDFDELEKQLETGLEESISGLKFLEEDKKRLGIRKN